ncbi:MAG: hypothetical protein AAFX41_13860 [Bacteroidota bacterium]
MARRRNWSSEMFRHLRRGKYDRALYYAAGGDPDLLLAYHDRKAEPRGAAPTPSAPCPPAQRRVFINGTPPTDEAWTIIHHLERTAGSTLPDGMYWYDAQCGAFGPWGQATWVFLPPALPLGGALPPHCSGPATGVFVNGRDVHPSEWQNLSLLVGPIYPGHYALDAMGNFGFAGQPPATNLRARMGF